MKIGKILYRYRSITSLPIIFILLIFSKPSIKTLIIGFVFSLFGEIIRFISVGYTGLTTRSKNVQSNVLVTNGPYGFVRNPIYFGNFFLSLGIVVSANTFFPWFIFIYIILFSFQYFFIIRYEEKFLLSKFEQEYSEYLRSVPSFFPRLKPYYIKNSMKPDFKKALLSERTTIFIVIMLFFIIWLINFYSFKISQVFKFFS